MTVPRWIVPVLILIMTGLGLWTARLIAIPSVTVDYLEGPLTFNQDGAGSNPVGVAK